ncbi:MAG: type II toxin-antitoxin system RelE/ParE family toxin [Proteobacteria bacterium]|nr:type II toxin-antitoxin system RelE/ParE family toxin [Pseudomonadota bacterium]MBU1582927.1 type II toxin-antitoxin system RelE/ParE family toxin [Pseudomonadota bacterium]MBU2452837.1 type II toxin-antitoxin system RelE/ParE family toxin [Pseudomonadota bacterium]
MNIQILDEAQADLREGAQFYERQNVGLGTYFLDTIFSDIDSLILYAGVHIQLNGYHRLLSKTFPYAVYYQIDADIIKIYAILDCRRNPNRTIEELKQRRT